MSNKNLAKLEIEKTGNIAYDVIETDRELLHEKLQRLSKVDGSNIITGDFSWIDEVVLVALGKKPIAHTHFTEIEEGDWDADVEDWCVEQGGVMSFSVMEYRHDINYIYDRKGGFNYYKKGEIVKSLGTLNPTKAVASIVWFREDTRKDALLIRHFNRLQQDGGNWQVPYFDMVQGILYGYPVHKIKEFVMSQYDVTDGDMDYYFETSYQYIDEMVLSYK